MKNKFLEGDWIKASRKGKTESLNKAGYVLKVSEDDILVRFLSGNTLVVPKSWAENLDDVLTEVDLKALIDLSLDLRDEHLFRMCVRDLQALQGK
ncbi:hypothetical protein [Bacillus safensis]|uniref:hypothetical protein n=1 Tax=Bacillus safensis TaxID=561879 RepID=UPI000D027C29|nr:hypothetical protein [Bacillus safensis]PRS24233.1 hypothetical protein C6X94_03600 [Bacillus safensis]